MYDCRISNIQNYYHVERKINKNMKRKDIEIATQSACHRFFKILDFDFNTNTIY